VTINNPGFNNCLKWKSAEFDSLSEIVRFKNKWFVYLRNNTGHDRRDIQFTTSDDLLNFSEFKPIKHGYDIDIDNYYYPVMFEHNKKLYGFFNYYNETKSSVKLKQSIDGETWEEITEFFIEFPHEILENVQMKHENKMTIKKTKCTSLVCSVEKTDKNIFFWVNHFYANNNKHHNSYVAKYKGNLNEL
jgi:hypothetical protein